MGGKLLTAAEFALVRNFYDCGLLIDQESQYSERFIEIAWLSYVEVTRTGVEAYSSLGLGERYHDPLRSTFCKIMMSRPDVEKTFVLSHGESH